MWLFNKGNLISVKCANFGQLDLFQQLILYIAVSSLYYTFDCLCCVENKVSCLFDKIIWKMIHDTNILFDKNLEFCYIVSKIKLRKGTSYYYISYLCKELSYALKKNYFDGLLHNLIY